MFLKELHLRNFRSYKDARFSFSPKTNLILGDNGQGKTNLLEAIHLVSTGRSFRTHTLSDLIAFGESFFFLEAAFEKEGVTQQIKIYYDETVRKVQYNQTLFPTLSSLLGILPSVLLSPDDLALMSGGPAVRRKFIDLFIAQTDPLYVFHLARYYRAMKQRNQLLRDKSEAAIESWEQMMAHSAEILVHKRREAIEALQNPASRWMEALSCHKETLSLRYDASVSQDFLQNWKKQRPKEMLLGSTLTGPHRDDISFYLGEQEVKHYSSEGQKRSSVAALRFAELERIESVAGLSPLLGIDDFGIQLDEERRAELQRRLPRTSQVFLTSPIPLNEAVDHTLLITAHV
ncbi:MAG: DNA replication/repair protein RecF [Verrucomicrobia bacterium]|nr:DNA replication/repair protein RecF [Verrucomicrobiota bacterium]